MLERIDNDRPLDMGFNRMPGQLGPEVLDIGFTLLDNTPLHMGFHSLPVHDGHPDHRPLDMGFGTNVVQSVDIQPEDGPLDMGFEIHHLVYVHQDQSSQSSHCLVAFGHGIRDTPSVDIQLGDRPLDMGFGTNPACDIAHQPDIQPEDAPLDMGFKTFHPGHVHPDQSFMVGEPEPIGFVIQRALGDLHLAINWLEMDIARGTMSAEEAGVSEEVLLSTHELLLAFQLISVY
ncbi:hypothetical protein DFJ58DRAFT_734281 [Suillus subalutaceus]|uniref:uncharacterized protein n=1 Tax=Suillus subalutaceus TaxID=48586 RepID=UPI001B87A59F|nr:uncharacterized protein DFJ58DRAFT_734281 [Suillus subalutaceus]KAG1837566.1 hypothetical protein DFJ58DRAFT_734281 [Suillus subalutaceus]